MAVNIIIGCVPIHGHVSPLLQVARHLVARGDRVRFVTGARFEEAVRGVGAEHVPLPAAADYDDRQDWAQVFPQRAELKGAKAIAFDVEHVFVRPGRGQHDAVMGEHSAEPADAILVDTAFAGGFLLGHSRAVRPPVVVCGILPLPLVSRDTAPYGMGLTPMAGPLGRLRNRALGAVAARTVFPRAQRAAAEINRGLHGVPLPYPVMDWHRHAEAIVQFTVREFEYDRSDAPATLHFAGPITPPSGTTPLPPWWSDLDGPRPVLHVTQGTIANRDYRQVIGPTLEAFDGDDVLVVVSTGGRPLDSLPSLPPNARAAEYLPYDQLLPRTDTYVTNGGYGGVQYALRHGVPVVTSGGKEDKPEVGARVEWSGVGRRLRSETPSVSQVRAAVRSVMDEPRYRDRARVVADSMARTDACARLAEVVDDVVAAS